jgi:hypothetical protein
LDSSDSRLGLAVGCYGDCIEPSGFMKGGIFLDVNDCQGLKSEYEILCCHMFVCGSELMWWACYYLRLFVTEYIVTQLAHTTSTNSSAYSLL